MYTNTLIESELVRTKAQIASAATRRLDAYALAWRMVEHVEHARREIDDENYRRGFEGKRISSAALAKKLNENGHLRSPGQMWGKSNVEMTLLRVEKYIVDQAVLECRTRMTAKALRADFDRSTVDVLEAEYLKIIAEAIELSHRMNGNRQRSAEELAEEAKYAAIDMAAQQRAKKQISMMARERLWSGFAPFPRKVFDSVSAK